MQEKELYKIGRAEVLSIIKFVRTLLYFAIVIVAFSIIVATRFFSILQVSGNSMEPSLYAGELLVASRFESYNKSDMLAFYYNNNILIKRVIATEGDIVYISDMGDLYVNSEKIEENYIQNKSYGINTNITFPYRVPDGEIFVLGDNREISLDSRSKTIGTISTERVLGKIKLKLNPLVIY